MPNLLEIVSADHAASTAVSSVSTALNPAWLAAASVSFGMVSARICPMSGKRLRVALRYWFSENLEVKAVMVPWTPWMSGKRPSASVCPPPYTRPEAAAI